MAKHNIKYTENRIKIINWTGENNSKQFWNIIRKIKKKLQNIYTQLKLQKGKIYILKK